MKKLKIYDIYQKKKVPVTNYKICKDKRGRSRAVALSPTGRGLMYSYI